MFNNEGDTPFPSIFHQNHKVQKEQKYNKLNKFTQTIKMYKDMTTLKEYIKTALPSMLFHSQMHPTYNGKVASKLYDVYVADVEEFLRFYNMLKEQAEGETEVILARHDTKQQVCFKFSLKGIIVLTSNTDPNQERLYFLPRNK